ncbi:MAG: DNA recombination protein RmuC [Bacteroidales bacterium]|nr:DNA recombination protein RmuC [Bacteroidales bacterium]MBQ5882258.1 DNA recombination protein RmuC [Bacteroidales bacterium]
METVLFAIISLMAGLLIAVVVMQKRAKRTQEQFQCREEELLQARDNAVASLYNVEGELKVSKERVALLEQSLAYFKESRKEDLASAQKEFEEKLEKLELLFKEKATEILKEKSRDLSQLNEGNLKNVVEPLSQKMEQFRKAVEESKEKSLENTTKVEEQIKAMISHTDRIKAEAHNLATALRSNNKVQGNWGELILCNILENMGLRSGQDFVLQQTLTDEQGAPLVSEETNRKMIPDAVVFLPEKRAVAIDSKVSLEAYTNYVNAEESEQKALYLQAHCKSVEAHIKELSAKEYGKYLNKGTRNSMEYVIMFIPNEGAFQLFYRMFPEKWHEAFDKKIIIAGESNLFAMLKIIETVWMQIRQQKNTEQVMALAGELLDRVAKFINTFEDVGKDFTKVLNKYEEAKNVLRGEGRQSILVTAKKMEKSGVVSKNKFLTPGEDFEE